MVLERRRPSFQLSRNQRADARRGANWPVIVDAPTSPRVSRIRVFEQTGSISWELFEKLAAFFDIDADVIEKLVEQDRREFFQKWLDWVNEPIQPHLVVRIISAVYSRRELSPGIVTIEEAEAWAASVAKESRMKCCLVWNRRLSIWFDETGRIAGRTEAVPGCRHIHWFVCGRDNTEPIEIFDTITNQTIAITRRASFRNIPVEKPRRLCVTESVALNVAESVAHPFLKESFP